MKNLLILLLLVLTFTCQAKPPGPVDIAYTLTGACAVWSLQGAKSEQHNNEVINNFLTSFWTDWAKQLNLSKSEAVVLCDAMLNAYNKKHPLNDTSPKKEPLEVSAKRTTQFY